ncbi:MAG: small subunit ribosomal protein [Clostridia bacterium]|uniref:Small ribosomal subunit protein uS17 n=1 Tax=Thermacetogenium phaeum TaxID=85874 RepID=A0A101FHU4_9THEO|nr:MAG: 30S ribosomal protein S17 [Thermacetogenium phaeum]MDK2880504.1 small subunit ribosomal protein [Clostridia bacterium]
MVERARRKTRIGRVVSDKMDKTVVVAVETAVQHPLYGRIVRRTKKFKAHDENNECRIGDQVKIMETRPLSKEKRWRVVEILQRADEVGPPGKEDEVIDPATDNIESGR